MPIPTPLKFAIAATACGYCWKVGDKDKAASLAEKIAAMIMCGACAGIAGNEVAKHGVAIYDQVRNGPPAPVNQVQQAPAPQPNKIKPPPKTPPAQNAIAGAGYVDVGVITASSAISLEGPRRSYFSIKKIKQMKQAEIRQTQDEEFINAIY